VFLGNELGTKSIMIIASNMPTLRLRDEGPKPRRANARASRAIPDEQSSNLTTTPETAASSSRINPTSDTQRRALRQRSELKLRQRAKQ